MKQSVTKPRAPYLEVWQSALLIGCNLSLLAATGMAGSQLAWSQEGTHSTITQVTPAAKPSELKEPSVSKEVDNTGRNVRDRHDDATTADAQSNEQGDIDTVAKIRSALIHNDTLSTYAKNVKIVIEKGSKEVVLRGVVNSVEEKHAVEQIAKKVGSPSQIRSDLDIATGKDGKPTSLDRDDEDTDEDAQ